MKYSLCMMNWFMGLYFMDLNKQSEVKNAE